LPEEPQSPQAPSTDPRPSGAPGKGRRSRRGRRGRGRGRGKGGRPAEAEATPPPPAAADPASAPPVPSLPPAPAPQAPPASGGKGPLAAAAEGGGRPRRHRRRRGRGGRGGEPRPEAADPRPAAPPPVPAPAAVSFPEDEEPEAAPAPRALPRAVPVPAKDPAARAERDFIAADRLRACEDAIGYHFRDVEFLRNALTHSSVKTENHPSNERMEFLGDSVLGHVIAEYIYHLLPDYDEGEMTKVKSVVVSTQGLAAIGLKMRLDKHLIVGRGISMRGTIPQSLMANTFEAVVSAVYLDRGFESARLFILDQLGPAIDDCLHDRHAKNYKSILQQIAQRDLNSTPTYKVRREEGPDHRKDFEVVAVVGGYQFEPAWGPTKREAEQRAARAAVMALTQRLDLRGAPKAEGG